MLMDPMEGMGPGHLEGVGAVPTGSLSLPSDRGAPTGTKPCQLPAALRGKRHRSGATMPDRNTGVFQCSLLSGEGKTGAGLETRRLLRAFPTRTVTAGAAIWDETGSNFALALLIEQD